MADRRDDEPRPHLYPTKWTTLVAVAAVSAVLGWVLTRHYYADFPRLPWFGSAALLALAVLEVATTVHIRRRLGRDARTDPIEPMTVARSAVLGKASALVGAVYAGAFVGIGGWLLSHRDVRAAEQDTPMALLAVGAGVALLAAALWLEHVCRIPPTSADDDRNAKAR